MLVDVPHRRTIAPCRVEHRDVLEARSLILEELVTLEFAKMPSEFDVLFGSHLRRGHRQHAVLAEGGFDAIEIGARVDRDSSRYP